MPTSSSARQALKSLGARLCELRQGAGLTARELARRAGWHESKVSKIEHGRQTPSAANIQTWCRHCAAEDLAVDLIASMRAIEEMFVDWRRAEQNGLRLAQASVVPLWERTRQFRVYSPRFVPGPLQTRGYIEALLAGIAKRRGHNGDDLDEAVQVRVDKQNAVYEGDRRLVVLIEESVLHQPIGSTEVMVGQLGYLLTVGALPSMALGIIPLGANRSTIWPVEGFWMFDDERVTVELVSGHLTITQPYEVAMYAKAFGMLRDLAVSGKRARSLITSAIEALGNQPG